MFSLAERSPFGCHEGRAMTSAVREPEHAWTLGAAPMPDEEGEDLGELIRRSEKLTGEQTADIMLAVCAAVDAAHEESVIHRDLKPENIFLSASRTL